MGDNVLDISQLEHINRIKRAQSEDGTVSKNYFISHQEDVEKFYKGITMKLDYGNDLFLSTGGMMFMDIDVEINMTRKDQHQQSVRMRSKITNGSGCILHGNGPGVILWRSYVKQIKNDGNLYVEDYVLR